jgi:hypothetical protein
LIITRGSSWSAAIQSRQDRQPHKPAAMAAMSNNSKLSRIWIRFMVATSNETADGLSACSTRLGSMSSRSDHFQAYLAYRWLALDRPSMSKFHRPIPNIAAALGVTDGCGFLPAAQYWRAYPRRSGVAPT